MTRKEIKEYLAGLPEGEVSIGIYATCGYKYVTIVNTWDHTTTKKFTFSEFEEVYM